MKRRSVVVLSLFLTLLLGLVITHDYLLGRITHYVLVRQCQRVFGQTPTATTWNVAGQGIQLQDVVFMETTTGEDSSYRLTAESVAVSVGFEWGWHPIAVDIAIEKPHIFAVQGSQTLPPLQLDMHGLSLPAKVRFSAHGGTVDIGEESGSNISSHRLSLCLEGEWLPLQGVGSCVALFSDEDSHDDLLQISLQRQKKRWELAGEMRNVPCEDVMRLTQLFSGHALTWHAIRGSCQGNVSMTWDDVWSLKSLSGDFFVKDVVADNKANKLSTQVGESHLVLHPDSNGDVNGAITFSPETSLSFYDDAGTYWQVQDAQGHITFKSLQHIDIAFGGMCVRGGERAPWSLEGHASLGTSGSDALFLNMRTQESDGLPVQCSFVGQQAGLDKASAEVSMKGVGTPEIRILQTVLAPYFPFWGQFKFYGGEMSALMSAHFVGTTPVDFKVVEFSGEDLDVDIAPWDIYVQAGKLKGSFDMDLSKENPWATASADITVEGGRAKLWGMNADFWQVTDLSTNFIVNHGVVAKTLVLANIAGLKSTLDCDFAMPQEVVRIHSAGTIQDLAVLLPPRLRQGLQRSIGMDPVVVEASVVRKDDAFALAGVIEVARGFSKDRITFGSDIDSSLTSGFGDPTTQAGFIKNGWFHGAALDLQKYASPFLFKDTKTQLTGTIDVQGTFDRNGILIEFNGNDVVLDNPSFKVTLPFVASPENRTAFHYFDFRRGAHFGYIPLVGGMYTHKASNVVFSDVSGEIHIEGQEIHITEMKTFADDIAFSGKIDIDCRSREEGAFTVLCSDIRYTGALPQFQKFAAKLLSATWIDKIPVQGAIHDGGRAGRVRFCCRPTDSQVEVIFGGRVEGASYSADKGCLFKDGSLSFSYDHNKGLLFFEDGKATLCADDDHSYDIALDSLAFHDLATYQGAFNVALRDSAGEICRLQGTTSSHNAAVEVDCDVTTSHLLGAPFSRALMAFSSSWEPLKGHVQASIPGVLAVGRIVPLVKACNASIPSHMWTALQSRVDVADVAFDIAYFGKGEEAVAQASSSSVTVDGTSMGSASLKVKQQGDMWLVEQCRLGEATFAADLQKLPDRWKINFLGCDCGQKGFVGMEGMWHPKDHVLSLQVNLLEASLPDLMAYSPWTTCLQQIPLHGKVRGTGSLTVNANDGFVVGGASLTLATRNLAVANVPLKDVSGVHLTYDAGNIALDNVATATKSDDACKVSVARVSYDAKVQETHVQRLQFATTKESVDAMARAFQKMVPEAFDEAILAKLQGLSKEGLWQGTLEAELSPAFWSAQLHLLDDVYVYDGAPYDLKDCFVALDPFRIKVVTQYHYKTSWYGVMAQVSLAEGDSGHEGVFKVLDLPAGFTAPTMTAWQEKEDAKLDTLTVSWRNDDLGPHVDKAKGTFSGFTVDVAPVPDQGPSPTELVLQGQLNVDVSLAAAVLPDEFLEMSRVMQLKDGYTLQGTLQLSRNHFPDVRFEGKLFGKDFGVGGATVESLEGTVFCSPQEIRVTDLVVMDPALEVHVDSFATVKDSQGKWVFSCPKVLAKNVRPGLFRKGQNRTTNPSKALVLRTLELHDVAGVLNDPKTLVGRGHVDFVNPSRRTGQSSLFAIPSDIIARLGLDLDVLNPVVGTILYNIHDGKVWLDEFRDIYSEGRMSRFYLPNTHIASYVDFDGTLNVRVKMKQYNLMFKLAELFTVSIQGDIKNPKFSIHKNKDAEDTANAATEPTEAPAGQ